MTSQTPATWQRSAARVALVAIAAAFLAGCYGQKDMTSSIPDDYRQRHPMTLREGDRTVELFVGSRRGGLTPLQRAEALAFAQSWKREATGGILIDLPSGTDNEHAARDAFQEIRSILAASDVPQQSIGVRVYRAGSAMQLAPIKLNYPRVAAEVGPCGLWPHDLGASADPIHMQNKQYWNLGCATQRNIASMAAEPADLVQPRATTPAYTARRTVAIDRYRQGQSPATTYPTGGGQISEVGRQ